MQHVHGTRIASRAWYGRVCHSAASMVGAALADRLDVAAAQPLAVAALSRTQTVGEVVEAMIAELRSQGLSGGGGGGGGPAGPDASAVGRSPDALPRRVSVALGSFEQPGLPPLVDEHTLARSDRLGVHVTDKAGVRGVVEADAVVEDDEVVVVFE